MSKKAVKQAFEVALEEFRDKYFSELENNIEVWKSIRDDSTESAKDRNEAAKNIAKVIGAFQSRPPKKEPEKKENKEEFSKDQREIIEKNVNAVLTDLHSDKNSGED